MKNKKKELILTIIAVLSLIVITVGVTYSVFTYTKTGTTENTITSEKIKFIYDEKENQVGNGIKIENAMPMSDELGKAQTGNGNVFNFKIASITSSNLAIPYEITIKKDSLSTLDEKLIKVYLAKVNGMVENQVALGNFSVEAGETTKVGLENYGTNEKLLYSGRIPTSTPNYEQNFVLKMWIDDTADFSPTVDGGGNEVYPLSGKTFKARVNVYANGNILTEEQIEAQGNTKISSVKVGESTLTKLTDTTLSYQYETTLPVGTTETTIEVEAENEYADVKIEKVASLAQATTSEAMIQRLSTRNTVSLAQGDNYFKVTITPEKGESKSYGIKIKVAETISIFGKSYEIKEGTPNLSTVSTGSETGLYKSTATNSGQPTYYFRGAVNNNWVSFAGSLWRIVRINEDGSIRIIMQDGVSGNAETLVYYSYMGASVIYSNWASETNYNKPSPKKAIDDWYQASIVSAGYTGNIVAGSYCEETKATEPSRNTAGVPKSSSYTVNFRCSASHNLTLNYGLLTYDEAVHAGGYYKTTSNFYLNNGRKWWMMTMAGDGSNGSGIWRVDANSMINVGFSNYGDSGLATVRPVINLNKNTTIQKGNGTSSSPFLITGSPEI